MKRFRMLMAVATAGTALTIVTPPVASNVTRLTAPPTASRILRGPVDAVWSEPIDRHYSYGPGLNERNLRAANAATASFTVTYDSGFAANLPAQAAFQAAANIWATILSSPVPIRVNASFRDLGNSLLLGSAGPTFICMSAAGQANTWYANALADGLARADTCASGEPEITANFNSAFSGWEYGISGAPVAGKTSFMTVVLHELGHGLGFYGSMTSSGGVGSWGESPGVPDIYDRFAFTGAGQSLLSFTSPSLALGAQLISGNTFFTGPNARIANSGTSPKLETSLNPFSRGSSYSHLDELSYSSTPNGLMTYQLANAEVYTDPGPITRGLFVDEGWATSTPTCAVITISQSTLPNMAVGVAYSTTITASGGTAPYRFSVAAGALPAGMTLTAAGVLAGTPTTAGTFTFTIRATDANGCFAERSYTTLIPSAPGCAVIAIAQRALPNMAVGVGYSLPMTASGGTVPYRFSLTAGALPPGMTLTAAGVLAGTPTTGGTYTFTIRATDANGCFAELSYTMFLAQPPVLQPPGPPMNFSASAFGFSAYLGWLGPIAGGAPTSYTIEAGSVTGAADFATLSTNGVTYVASTVGNGTYYLRVRAVNAAGTSAPSNEAILVIGNGCFGAPAAPTSLRAFVFPGVVLLQWDAARENPTTYVIEAGSTPGARNLVNGDLGSVDTSLISENVARGTYYVRIRGKNACGTGPASNEIVVTVS